MATGAYVPPEKSKIRLNDFAADWVERRQAT
jgi:hypothetical protein